MLPLAVTCRPAARRIDSSMPVVVVLPLVPVTTSQSRGAPLAWSSRQASSTSPITSMPARRSAAASSGFVGGMPAEVTTRVVPSGGVCQVAGEGDVTAERGQLRPARPGAGRFERDHDRRAGAGEIAHHRQPGDADTGGQHQVAGGRAPGRGRRRSDLSHRSGTAIRRRTGRDRAPPTSPRAARTAPSPWFRPSRTARNGGGTAPS